MVNSEGKKFVRELTSSQLAAIRRAAVFGKKIQLDLPEVAIDYQGGLYLREIAEKYNIQSRYNLSTRIAISAVRCAIVGVDHDFNGLCSYGGLISDTSELEQIRIKLVRQGGIEGGKKSYEMGVGVHGMDLVRRREIGRKGGLITGPLTYQKCLGVHGLSHDEKVAAGYKSRYMNAGVHSMTREQLQECSRKGAIARGEVLWSDDEIKFAHELSNDEEYRMRNSANNEKIADTINIKYHNGERVRTASMVSNARKRYLKSLESKVL